MKNLKSFLLLSIIVILSSCSTFQSWLPFGENEYQPSIKLTNHDRVTQILVLLADLELKSEVAPLDSMPFTQNSYALLIVGEQFPHQKLSEILGFVRNYYTDLHYVALANENDFKLKNPAQLFIGAKTDLAINHKLTAWSTNDFEKLKAVKSQPEMLQTIKQINSKSAK
ncbi:MAG: hypothetical protein H3C43_02220 [Leptonema sp. (in: Bacteria)]|nr:hypothetical protein [Leptonema sp. (in: bacteria)]